MEERYQNHSRQQSSFLKALLNLTENTLYRMGLMALGEISKFSHKLQKKGIMCLSIPLRQLCSLLLSKIYHIILLYILPVYENARLSKEHKPEVLVGLSAHHSQDGVVDQHQSVRQPQAGEHHHHGNQHLHHLWLTSMSLYGNQRLAKTTTTATSIFTTCG